MNNRPLSAWPISTACRPKNGAEIRFNTTATREAVQALNPYAVIGAGLTAEKLAEDDNQVLVVEMRDQIGQDALPQCADDVVSRLRSYAPTFITGQKLVQIKNRQHRAGTYEEQAVQRTTSRPCRAGRGRKK